MAELSDLLIDEREHGGTGKPAHGRALEDRANIGCASIGPRRFPEELTRLTAQPEGVSCVAGRPAGRVKVSGEYPGPWARAERAGPAHVTVTAGRPADLVMPGCRRKSRAESGW
jgi:hypothetical protein